MCAVRVIIDSIEYSDIELTCLLKSIGHSTGLALYPFFNHFIRDCHYELQTH